MGFHSVKRQIVILRLVGRRIPEYSEILPSLSLSPAYRQAGKKARGQDDEKKALANAIENSPAQAIAFIL